MNHSNHYQMSTEHLIASVQMMPETERALARQCAQLCFTSNSVSSLLAIRDELGANITWSASQLWYMTKKDREIALNLSADANTAERLVETFSQRDDVNYLYVTFHPNDGMLLFTSTEKKRVDCGVIEARNLWENSMLEEDGRLLILFLYASKEEIRLRK